jgi:hypothetical protein
MAAVKVKTSVAMRISIGTTVSHQGSQRVGHRDRPRVAN